MLGGSGVIAMTSSQDKSPRARQARYRQIAEQLRTQILSGVYRAGDRLPTELELGRLYGVSRVTSAAALDLLARDGLVQRAPRRGTLVRAAPYPARMAARPLLAWLQPSVDYGFGLQLLCSLEQASHAAGFNLLLRFTGTERRDEEQAIRDAVASGASAIALWLQDGEMYNAEVLRLVVAGFPVVLVDRHLRGVECACVGSDNIQGVRALMEHLIAQGHRAICALVFSVKGTSTIEERLDGYMQALAAAGIPIDHSLIYIADRGSLQPNVPVPDAHVRRFAEFLHRRTDVTAIFASNAYLGLLAQAALDHLRLRVPDDVSLVSVDGLLGLPTQHPTISCAMQQSGEIGVKTVELAREGLAGKPPRRVLLPMHVSAAGSIMPPRPRRAGA